MGGWPGAVVGIERRGGATQQKVDKDYADDMPNRSAKKARAMKTIDFLSSRCLGLALPGSTALFE